MVFEAVQSYVNLVNGLTRATRARAMANARAVLAHAGLEGAANDASERLGRLTEEILPASRANRQLHENVVSAEVDRSAARWGFVRTDEVNVLREEIAQLRNLLIDPTEAQPASSVTDESTEESPAQVAAVEQSAAQDAALAGAVVGESAGEPAGESRPSRLTDASDLRAQPAAAEDSVAATDPASDTSPGSDQTR